MENGNVGLGGQVGCAGWRRGERERWTRGRGGRKVCVWVRVCEREKTDVRESTSKVHDLGLSRSACALCVSCVFSMCVFFFVCAKE